jgi:hypothetical protein
MLKIEKKEKYEKPHRPWLGNLGYKLAGQEGGRQNKNRKKVEDDGGPQVQSS